MPCNLSRWVVSIRQVDASHGVARDHVAFLNSYAPEDEGLYDDYPVGCALGTESPPVPSP